MQQKLLLLTNKIAVFNKYAYDLSKCLNDANILEQANI
jgi:hypothetical protein